MSAVAVAMSLSATAWADGPTGTSFEGLTTGDYDITATTGELAAQASGSYWETNETATLTVKAYQQGEQVPDSQGVARPAVYENATQANYLSVKTTLGHPVSRYVNADGATASMEGGIYFDSFVKFTAFDGDQTVDMSGGKKLAIWLNADEDSATPSTNLVVTAGYLMPDSEEGVVSTNYNCQITGSVNFNDGGWHRVTVKALETIYSGDTAPGFVVFIDGEKVVCGAEKGIDGSLTANAAAFNAEGSLFPSACQMGGHRRLQDCDHRRRLRRPGRCRRPRLHDVRS